MPRAAKSAGVKRAAIKKAVTKIRKPAPVDPPAPRARRAVAKKVAQPEPKGRASAQPRRTKKEAPPKASPIRPATLADQGPKVQRLLDSAKAAKWKSSVENPSKQIAIVTLIRDDEEIIVTFADGKLDRSHRPIYRIGGQREVLLKGASGVIKQMAGQGKVAKNLPKREKRAAKKHESGGQHRVIKIPFDINDPNDDAILDGVAGSRIEWRTGIMNDMIDDARIRPLVYCPACGHAPQDGATTCNRTNKCGGIKFKEQTSIRLKSFPEDPGDLSKRILTFVDARSGRTRSIYLSAIITVRK